MHHLRAISALPDTEGRARAWQQVLEGRLSNDHLSASLEGLASSQWNGEELTAAFFHVLDSFWASHSIGMSIRFIHGAFPRSIDIERSERSTDLLAAARQWLATHTHAPEALRRLIIEHTNDVERALHVQETTL